MRTPVDRLVTEASLTFVSNQHNARLMEHLIESNADQPEISKAFRNVCAKMPNSLADRLDDVVRMLDVHKRVFVEAAIDEALNKAEQIMRDEGVYEAIEFVNKIEQETGGSVVTGGR